MPFSSLLSYPTGLGTGAVEVSELGTGQSGPLGVEAVLEYNGIYLNLRDWVDTYLITSIDGLGDADVRDAREVNPQQDGETFFDAFYGGRTIVLTGRIRAHHIFKLRDMQQILRQTFADISQEHPLIFHSQNPLNTLQILCKKFQPLVMAEVQQNFKWERDFQISLRASNPRFVSLLPTATTITVGNIVPTTIVNNGNYFAQPILTLENQMTAPRLVNESTGQELKFSGNLVNGERVTVDFATRRITLQTGVSVINRLAPDSDWPELGPGENAITVLATGIGGTASAVLNYRHTFM